MMPCGEPWLETEERDCVSLSKLELTPTQVAKAFILTLVCTSSEVSEDPLICSRTYPCSRLPVDS